MEVNMVDKEEAVWKTYPEIDFLQANQFGEVRTIDRTITDKNGSKRRVKGRVLKQRLRPDGYMEVNFKVNNKPVKLLTHRVIAASYLPNPNNLPEVNHKDNDRTNNAVSNLELCTREYNQDYKEKYGISAAEAVGRPVFAVDLKTGRILRFETRTEAARKLGIDVSSIVKVVKGKANQAGGYWFTEDESEITEEKIQGIKAKTHFLGGVIAVNPDTFEVFWFESQHEAARQFDISQGNIPQVIKGRYNTAGGYWFCYADSEAVEKTRAKFGEDVANQVEKITNKL